MSALPLHDIGDDGSIFSYRYTVGDDQIEMGSYWFLVRFHRGSAVSQFSLNLRKLLSTCWNH